jgi:hypothetical protein
MRRAGECILIFQILNSVFLGSVAILDLTRYGTNTFEESPPLNLFKLFFSVWRVSRAYLIVKFMKYHPEQYILSLIVLLIYKIINLLPANYNLL